MTTTRRSRHISSSGSIAIEKEDFISGMLAALSNKDVIEKLQTVDDLEVALDDHEQYSRRNSLRLFGLVESENEDITK